MNQEHCPPQGPDPAAPGLSDWLMDLLGRSVADLGATRRPGTSSSGAVWGSIPTCRRARHSHGTGHANRYRSPVRHRMAGGSGRRTVRPVRPRCRSAFYDAGTGLRHGRPAGPALPAAFRVAVGALRAAPRITDAFRTGDGMGWHEHDSDVFIGCGSVLPARLCGESGTELAARTRRRRGQAHRRCPGRRRGVRARVLDSAARPGVPPHDDRGIGLPHRVDRGHTQAGRRRRSRRPDDLRGGIGTDFTGSDYDLVAPSMPA